MCCEGITQGGRSCTIDHTKHVRYKIVCIGIPLKVLCNKLFLVKGSMLFLFIRRNQYLLILTIYLEFRTCCIANFLKDILKEFVTVFVLIFFSPDDFLLHRRRRSCYSHSLLSRRAAERRGAEPPAAAAQRAGERSAARSSASRGRRRPRKSCEERRRLQRKASPRRAPGDPRCARRLPRGPATLQAPNSRFTPDFLSAGRPRERGRPRGSAPEERRPGRGAPSGSKREGERRGRETGSTASRAAGTRGRRPSRHATRPRCRATGAAALYGAARGGAEGRKPGGRRGTVPGGRRLRAAGGPGRGMERWAGAAGGGGWGWGPLWDGGWGRWPAWELLAACALIGAVGWLLRLLDGRTGGRGAPPEGLRCPTPRGEAERARRGGSRPGERGGTAGAPRAVGAERGPAAPGIARSAALGHGRRPAGPAQLRPLLASRAASPRRRLSRTSFLVPPRPPRGAGPAAERPQAVR